MLLKGFSSEMAHYKKGWISVVQEFFASITERFILAGGLGYHSREFRYFPDYS